MGVDVTHIIRNDFVDDGTEKTRMAYCNQTIARLRKALSISDEIEPDYFADEGESVDLTFRLPEPFDVVFTLHQNFWQIESYFHYCQIVMNYKRKFYLRDRIKQIAQALGQNEVWHAEEYLTWNCAKFDMYGIVCEDWWKFIDTEFPDGIPEWKAADWIDKEWGKDEYDYAPIYHDDLADY